MNIAAAEGKNCAIIIGATNQYEALDEAVRRRFDLSLYIGLPDISARVDILKKILKDIELDPRWFDVKQVAKQTEGYSSRDLYLLCKAAVHIPVQEATLSLTAERKKSFLTRILKANEVSNKDSDIVNSNRSTINAVNEANSSRIDRNESESFLRNKKEANDVKKYHQMISQEHNESDEISEKEETEDSNIVTPRPLRTLVIELYIICFKIIFLFYVLVLQFPVSCILTKYLHYVSFFFHNTGLCRCHALSHAYF